MDGKSTWFLEQGLDPLLHGFEGKPKGHQLEGSPILRNTYVDAALEISATTGFCASVADMWYVTGCMSEPNSAGHKLATPWQIGRASCREQLPCPRPTLSGANFCTCSSWIGAKMEKGTGGHKVVVTSKGWCPLCCPFEYQKGVHQFERLPLI